MGQARGVFEEAQNDFIITEWAFESHFGMPILAQFESWVESCWSYGS